MARIIFAALGALTLFASSASAEEFARSKADSTAGTATCTTMRNGEYCYLVSPAGSQNTSVIDVGQCDTGTIFVFGTSESVTPQACDDSSCTNNEDLVTSALTGDAALRSYSWLVPLKFIRVSSSTAAVVTMFCQSRGQRR